MSNRVVCREASHAGSWYTASGRAPGRPARPPPPPPPGPAPGRPRSAARPRAAAGGTRARTAADRGPRREGAGRGRPRRLPHPGGISRGSPWPAALALWPELGERESCRLGRLRPPSGPGSRKECAPGPSLLVGAFGSREKGGRPLPPPGARFARHPSPASPTRSRATLCPREGRAFLPSSPLTRRRPRPGSSQPPGVHTRPCPPSLSSPSFPGSLEREAAFPPHLSGAQLS